MTPPFSEVVAQAMNTLPRARRGPFLRDLLATVAAALVVHEGEQAGAEAVYRLADAIVSRDASEDHDPSRLPRPPEAAA